MLTEQDYYYIISDLKTLGGSWLTENAFEKVKRVGDSLNFCCPFHKEDNPSCGISLKHGGWNCFSCGMHGNIKDIVQLCLRCDKDYAEKYLMLFEKNETILHQKVKSIKDKLSLSTKNSVNLEFPTESEYLVKCIGRTHDYFYKRGLDNYTIQKFELGFDPISNTVVFPVRDENGSIAFFQRRSVSFKRFYNDRQAKKSEILYGLYYLIKSQKCFDTIAITESIIDTLSLYKSGIPSVSLMGRNMSEKQVKLLRYISPKTVILFLDNDEAGWGAIKEISPILQKEGYIIKVPLYPYGVKDANDLLLKGLLSTINYQNIINWRVM